MHLFMEDLSLCVGINVLFFVKQAIRLSNDCLELLANRRKPIRQIVFNSKTDIYLHNNSEILTKCFEK